MQTGWPAPEIFMQERSDSEFDGRPGGTTRQSASEFLRKAIWRPSTLAELKRLTEHRLGGNYADFLPVVCFVDIAVPTFVQALWIEILGNRVRRLSLQHSAGKQQSDVAHQAFTAHYATT